ncbi:MAG: hypothetical protein L0Z62_42120 [Gemmataceae bacterium]|nr:hypothetical protein [Gemmataceae bacterium]
MPADYQGQHGEALAAFRETVAVLRQAFEQTPTVSELRLPLSKYSGRLAYWLGLHGQRVEAATCYGEQEKLWPDDPEKLMELSRDFEQLAAGVEQSQKELTPVEQAERQRYLDESARLARKASAWLNQAMKP